MHSHTTIPKLITFLIVITTGLYAQEGIRPPDAWELHGLVDDILTGTHQEVVRSSIASAVSNKSSCVWVKPCFCCSGSEGTFV